MKNKSMEIVCWNEIPISNGTHTHTHSRLNDIVMMKVSMGPVLLFELFKRIALNTFYYRCRCQYCCHCRWRQTNIASLHFLLEMKFERETQLNMTQNGKITESFTVYLYEAVKLTFKTLALNYSKMKNFNDNSNNKRSTSTLNLKICVSTAEKFLHQIHKSPEWILLQSAKWAVGDFQRLTAFFSLLTFGSCFLPSIYSFLCVENIFIDLLFFFLFFLRKKIAYVCNIFSWRCFLFLSVGVCEEEEQTFFWLNVWA